MPGAVLDAGGAELDTPGSWLPGVHGVLVERHSQPRAPRTPWGDSRQPGRAWCRFPGKGEGALGGGDGSYGRVFSALSVGVLKGPRGEGPEAGEVGRGQTGEDCGHPVGNFQFTQTRFITVVYFNLY